MLRRLREADDPVPARTAIKAILRSPCLDRSLTQLPFWAGSDELAHASSLALAEWWREGGETAMQHVRDDRPAVVFAPDLRTSLTLETHAAHRLAPLLCSVRDPQCGTETVAWLLDLEREFERVALRERARSRELGNDSADPDSAAACAVQARKEPVGDRIMDFIGCVDGIALRPTMPPLGRIKRPTGWLVMHGRRGHYQFCDELRAYHLDSGAAYVVQRCSGLALNADGSVDQGATSAASNIKTTVGTISTEAIGRVALVLALATELQDRVRRTAAYFEIPPGIPVPGPGTGFGSMRGLSSWGSSAQTRIAYTLVQKAKILASGELTWPKSSDAGDQVADDLLVSAEATLRAGCAPVALPRAVIPGSNLTGVSKIDASKASLAQANQELVAALLQLAATPTCKKTKG